MNRKPNILFLFPDQHRGDWMPGGDCLPINMPHIAELMNRGVSFSRAITPSPLCAPARACLASGKRYANCGVRGNNRNYPLEQKTFYSVLKENGYAVGGVGKFDLHKASRWWGLDGWIDDLGTMGFTHAIDNAGKWDALHTGKEEPKDPYMKYLHDHGLAEMHVKDMETRKKDIFYAEPMPLPDDAYCDNWITSNGTKMIDSFEKNKPWFMMVNFTGPHDPWDVPESAVKKWRDVTFPEPNQYTGDKAAIQRVRQNYAAMLENIDANIGELIRAVEKRGELDNTIIIYASDHGELLGDFNRFRKDRPERGSVHIPLVISGPGIQTGVECDALVELQDLAGTILELAGLSMPETEDSLSLVPVLTGQSSTHRDYQMSALKEWKMVSEGRYKLVIYDNGDQLLYDLENDPWENINVASQHAETIERLMQYV